MQTKELFNSLGGLDLDNIEYLAELKEAKGDKYKAFLAFCSRTYNSEYFEPFIKALKYQQLKKVFDTADNYEQFNFGRIMSISLDILYNEFKERDTEYQYLIHGK